ncbi:hypothetical protein LCGC14_0207840 [marine sediment metagenome]|uniref:Uncharacterized protein n=1 Tax=marine sediment metagenome TaxID=412755 RepID=A0A0F9XJQ5_9ZZZZ
MILAEVSFMKVLQYPWVFYPVRRYDFICSVGCYYHWTGRKHTCTDCNAKEVS